MLILHLNHMIVQFILNRYLIILNVLMIVDRKTHLDYSIYKNSTSKYWISRNGVLAIENTELADN